MRREIQKWQHINTPKKGENVKLLSRLDTLPPRISSLSCIQVSHGEEEDDDDEEADIDEHNNEDWKME